MKSTAQWFRIILVGIQFTLLQNYLFWLYFQLKFWRFELQSVNVWPFTASNKKTSNQFFMNAWDERKAGRKRITPNLTIHTPCHFCWSTIFDPSPWPVSIDQTNKWPFPPGKLKHYLWMSPYVKPEMKGRPGGRGSHATQPFTRQTAFKAKETCNLNKFNLVSFKKRLHFFSALCLSNPGFLGF